MHVDERTAAKKKKEKKEQQAKKRMAKGEDNTIFIYEKAKANEKRRLE